MTLDGVRFYPPAKRCPAPDPQSALLTILDDAGAITVQIARDGTITYGHTVDLDELSERFWAALARSIPDEMRGCPDPAAHDTDRT